MDLIEKFMTSLQRERMLMEVLSRYQYDKIIAVNKILKKKN